MGREAGYGYKIGSDFNLPILFYLDNPTKKEENPGRGQAPHTSLPLPQTSREDLRFDGYLEYPPAQRHYTFTNIHVFPGIRTQTLRHHSQGVANHYPDRAD
ncbi:hypothetical protein TNCV_3669231 [Trichonephila clavipes]|nr:hypothetical protein TNCV_3669231 [Trichonephila clavipes]